MLILERERHIRGAIQIFRSQNKMCQLLPLQLLYSLWLLQVSYTAVSFAAYRAIESERPDALFQDPLAAFLAGERVVRRQKAEVATKDYPGARFAVRTKYFDLAMLSAIEEMKVQNSQAKVQVRRLKTGLLLYSSA